MTRNDHPWDNYGTNIQIVSFLSLGRHHEGMKIIEENIVAKRNTEKDKNLKILSVTLTNRKGSK